MGAQSFCIQRTKGTDTAKQAFEAAREQAAYDYGHRGYTGTIAEKNSYVVLPCIEGKTPEESAWHYVQIDHPKIYDKWGPAGCIECPTTDKYYFFGWASC